MDRVNVIRKKYIDGCICIVSMAMRGNQEKIQIRRSQDRCPKRERLVAPFRFKFGH
ncbi:hypothetical protein LINGRAHAP2_LOCUS30000 [Linum grandiflorum]